MEENTITTIQDAIDELQQDKENLGNTLITKFGVQEQDIVEDGEITSSGLKDENGNWKKLSAWKTIVNNTNVDADTVDGKHASEFADISKLSKVATSGSYNDLSDKPTIPSWVTNTEPSYVKYTAQTLTDTQKTQVKTNLGLQVLNYHINDLTHYRLNSSLKDEFTLSYTYNGVLCKTTNVWTDANAKVFQLVGHRDSPRNRYMFYIVVTYRSDSQVDLSREAILADSYRESKHQISIGYPGNPIDAHFYITGQCVGLTSTATELYAGMYSGITYTYTNPVTVLNIGWDAVDGFHAIDYYKEEELHIFKVASPNIQVYINEDYKMIGDFSNFDTTKTYVLSLKSHIAIIEEAN